MSLNTQCFTFGHRVFLPAFVRDISSRSRFFCFRSSLSFPLVLHLVLMTCIIDPNFDFLLHFQSKMWLFSFWIIQSSKQQQQHNNSFFFSPYLYSRDWNEMWSPSKSTINTGTILINECQYTNRIAWDFNKQKRDRVSEGGRERMKMRKLQKY